jgi:Tol biopolymer transport system component
VGRVERGATVRIVAREGVSAADSIVTNVAVTPAGAGAVSGTAVRLLQSGPVTISARTRDGRAISAVLDVKAPPSVWFDAVASGNRDIYSVALDGGDLKRWTTAASEDAHPSVAGATLVFSTLRHGNAELYAIPTGAVGAEQRLTTTAASETEPALNRAGTSVAFVSDASGAPRVYVAPISLASPARLTAASFGFQFTLETDPTWSPAGDRLAFMATATGGANLFTAASTPGAMPVPVAGSSAEQTDVEPAWSPDGNQIAFASTRAGAGQIFLLDVRTGVSRQVTSGPAAAGQPGWLADGRLVFTRFATNETSLWWVDPASAEDPVEVPLAGVRLAAHAVGGR